MFIEEDYLRNPQKILYIISICGIIFSCFGHLIVIILIIYHYYPPKYFTNFSILLAHTILILLSFAIAGCCWERKILKNATKTSFRRFLVFLLVFPLSLATLIIGIYIILFNQIQCHKCETECKKQFISTPYYNLTDCIFSTCNSNTDCQDNCSNFNNCKSKCQKNECFMEQYKNNNLFKAYYSVLAFQFLSQILLIVAFIVMLTNLSDKEITQSSIHFHAIDYFRKPQKQLFLIAMWGFILGTFAQFGISLYTVPLYTKEKQFQAELDIKKDHSEKVFESSDNVVLCNKETKCENIKNYKDKKTCSEINCIQSNFYLTKYCEYLYKYIYKCNKNHVCDKLGECKYIERYHNENNCSYWDDCPNNTDYYYYGFCDFTKSYVYDCTRNNLHFNNPFSSGYKCSKIANCTDLRYVNTNTCSYFPNCITQSKFNYTFYCGLYSDYIYHCIREKIHFAEENEQNFIFFLIILVFGCIQITIVSTSFIISKTCLKNMFFQKILEIPFIRFSIHLLSLFLYPSIIFIEFCLLTFLDNEPFDTYLIRIFMFSFCIVQILSIIFYLIAIYKLKTNKSDIEILENTAELTRPLINNF